MSATSVSLTDQELLYFPLKQFSPRFGNNFFTFKIESYSLSKTALPFVQYTITMYLGKSVWTIERRFSHFVVLSKHLKDSYTVMKKKGPSLPPKTCSRVTGDEKFLQERQKLLGDYLDELLSLLSKEKLLADQKVKSFLGFTEGFVESTGFQYCL